MSILKRTYKEGRQVWRPSTCAGKRLLNLLAVRRLIANGWIRLVPLETSPQDAIEQGRRHLVGFGEVEPSRHPIPVGRVVRRFDDRAGGEFHLAIGRVRQTHGGRGESR